MSTKDFEDEWERVKSNPPNVILSDELRAILPEEYSAPSASQDIKAVSVDAEVRFARSQTVQGRLMSFSKCDAEHVYTLECSATEAVKCLADHDVEVLTFKTSTDVKRVDVERDPATEGSRISVDFVGTQATSAILSVKIFKLSPPAESIMG